MCNGRNYTHHLPLNAVTGIEELIRSIALQIHQGKLTPDTIPNNLIQLIASELMKGVDIGAELSTGSISAAQAQLMRENVFVFSGFKSHAQLREISAMLTDSSGNPRPFSQFVQDALQVNKTYNVNYLEAEYNHAIASGQMAGNWQHAVDNVDVAPYLTYQTAEDDHVRPAHAALNKISKPVTDPFWDVYYPPNGWNCRCDAAEDFEPPADAAQPDYGIIQDIPPMFRNNVGKTGVIFPDTHPYFDIQNPALATKITEQAKGLAAQ